MNQQCRGGHCCSSGSLFPPVTFYLHLSWQPEIKPSDWIESPWLLTGLLLAHVVPGSELEGRHPSDGAALGQRAWLASGVGELGSRFQPLLVLSWIEKAFISWLEMNFLYGLSCYFVLLLVLGIFQKMFLVLVWKVVQLITLYYWTTPCHSLLIDKPWGRVKS